MTAGENDATGSDRRAQLSAGLTAVTERVAAACLAAGRDPREVRILPVTKFFPASDVEHLITLGCLDFGESRVQDAERKVEQVAQWLAERATGPAGSTTGPAGSTTGPAGSTTGPADPVTDPARRSDTPTISWHMIGRLQRNKATGVGRWAASVHSVDDPRLPAAIARGARQALDCGQRSDPVDVLVQVSLDGDTHRGGVEPERVAQLADDIAALPELRLAGVMAVPPLGADPDTAFARLAEIHRELLVAYPEAVERSAGMTADLEPAIRHGSTCVRVGTAILGERPITSQVNSRNIGNSGSAGGARESGHSDERKVDR